MEEKDLAIIKRLRINSRMPLTKLSKDTGVPISTIFDRMKKYNFVIKHTTILDYQKLGYQRAYILIRGCKREILGKLFTYNNINSITEVEGKYDYLVDFIFKKPIELDQLIEDIGEANLELLNVSDSIKTEEFLTA